MDAPHTWPSRADGPAGPASSYSIKREFAGAEVLLTGASGYIGSVVLEQLLRTTDVGRVHLLLRPRKGQSIQDRAHKLLQGALFHKVREDSGLLSKVCVVGGDISLPGLGLSPSDRAGLTSSVNFIIHCAADIRLEADIQETLTSNYEGTRTVLELAASAQRLRGLVHVSSAFVNMNMPRGSIIDEAVYPLRLGRQVVDVEEVARELLSIPSAEANQRAQTYTQLFQFANTYALGKHMSEQLVARYQAQLQLPIAIVRPSLVSAIAGEPYPGFVGNWAGLIGASAAMAVGMYDKLSSVSLQPTSVWDVVPADMVAANILAAAAAVSAGAAGAICRVAHCGVVKGSQEDARVLLGYTHPLATASEGRCLDRQGLGSSRTAACCIFAAKVAAKMEPGGITDDAAADDTPAAGDLIPAVGVLEGGTCSMGGDTPPSDNGSDSPSWLSLASYSTHNPLFSTSSSRRSSCAGAVSAAASLGGRPMQQLHQRPPLLIVHAATSSTYPITLMEGWNYLLPFLEAHPPPFRLTWGRLPHMPADFRPHLPSVNLAQRLLSWKVWAVGGLLRLMGHDRAVRKLQAGLEAFSVQNNPKNDTQLVFSSRALLALEAALEPAEAREYLLVWRPMTMGAREAQLHGSKGAVTAPQGQLGSSSGGGEAGSRAAEGVQAGVCGGSALAPVQGDLTWKRYLHTQMAGVYSVVFGVEPPQRQQLGAVAAAAAQGSAGGDSDAGCIVHDFQRIK